MLESILQFLFFALMDAAVSLLYWPGWLILRMLTLGKYPPAQTENHNRYFVASVAVVMAILSVGFIYS